MVIDKKEYRELDMLYLETPRYETTSRELGRMVSEQDARDNTVGFTYTRSFSDEQMGNVCCKTLSQKGYESYLRESMFVSACVTCC